jgi:hypothetical protein
MPAAGAAPAYRRHWNEFTVQSGRLFLLQYGRLLV